MFLTQSSSWKKDFSSFVSACWLVLRRWWRRGEVWEIAKSSHVRLDGCRIGLEDSFPPGFRNLLLTGTFEKPERESIRRFLNPELPVIELGGCIGVVSCVTNRRLRHPGQHVVVEANPDMIPELKKNRDRNGCQFSILHGAVGYESSGDIEMSFHHANPLASSAYRAQGASLGTTATGLCTKKVSHGRTETIPAITLSSILDEHPFERFTLICDIEGTEVELIEREREILATRAALIIVEIHEKMLGPKATRRVHETLSEAQFEVIHRIGETFVLQRRTGVQ